jgi:hypothetical protein
MAFAAVDLLTLEESLTWPLRNLMTCVAKNDPITMSPLTGQLC